MKKIAILLFLITCVHISESYSQVTIGSDEKPNSGSLLQLKNIDGVTDASPNATKGLLLPRVVIPDLSSIEVIDGAVQSNALDYIGMLVYNVETVERCMRSSGLTVWDGNSWVFLTKDISTDNIPGDNILASGDDGGINIQWKVTCDSTLHLIGEGDMYDFTSLAPWNMYKGRIRYINVDDRITSIGEKAFSQFSFYNKDGIFSNLSNLKTINANAFSQCHFYGISNFSSLASLTEIGKWAFSQCHFYGSSSFSDLKGLNKIGGVFTFSQCYFYGSSIFANLDNLKTIGTNAFSQCTFYSDFTLTNANKLEVIEDSSFSQCHFNANLALSNLASLKTIENSAFSQCDFYGNLTLSNLLNLKSIGNYCFGGYSQSSSIILLNLPSLVLVDRWAFSRFSALVNLTTNVNPNVFTSDVFNIPTDSRILNTTSALYSSYNKAPWTTDYKFVVKATLP